MVAISFGYAAVNLFAGFTTYMYEGLQEASIYGTMKGHLSIFKEGFLEEGQLNPSKYLLSPEELKIIHETCSKEIDIFLATPQININGIITNGKISTIFFGRGIVPSSLDTFWKRRFLTKVQEFEGTKLKDDVIDGVGVSRGLARLIDLDLGSTAVILSNTVDGQINALDIVVVQFIDIPGSILEDKVILVPLPLAQSLYDTKGADRVVLLIDETENTELIRMRLVKAFEKKGQYFDIKTWKEMSSEYLKTKNMFDVIFFFLFIIVFIIVIMSVVNTMSMAVFERTREIGTLRALGLKRKGVLFLFSLESIILGALGALCGTLLTLGGCILIDIIKPMWTPPIMVKPIPLVILLVPRFLIISFFIMTGLCLFASLIPARKGAMQNVVDALGHV